MSLDTLITELEHALRTARGLWLAALPEFPPDGTCPECGSTEWQIEERGYNRWTDAEWLDDHLHATTDGWDDFSEHGDFEFVVCWNRAHLNACTFACQLPDHVDYD